MSLSRFRREAGQNHFLGQQMLPQQRLEREQCTEQLRRVQTQADSAGRSIVVIPATSASILACLVMKGPIG